MNVEQFNEKYKDYLLEGCTGLSIDDESVIKYLDDLFETYLTKIEGFVYYQIIFKENQPFFYSSLCNQNIKDSLITDLVGNTINTLLTITALVEDMKTVLELN